MMPLVLFLQPVPKVEDVTLTKANCIEESVILITNREGDVKSATPFSCSNVVVSWHHERNSVLVQFAGDDQIVGFAGSYDHPSNRLKVVRVYSPTGDQNTVDSGECKFEFTAEGAISGIKCQAIMSYGDEGVITLIAARADPQS